MHKRSSIRVSLSRLVIIAAIVCLAFTAASAQTFRDAQEAMQETQYHKQLQQVLHDKADYAAAIVRRWEDAARASGRWDENSAADLYDALIQLQLESLLAAGEASSYDEMMRVLATGPSVPEALGDVVNDLVYTPVRPCRIVDTRRAGGAISARTTRSFDVDGSTFSAQGGFNGSCGIPFGVARAVAMTLTVAQSTAAGHFRAWQVSDPRPGTLALTFPAGQTVSNTTLVSVVPGGGNDFNLFVGGPGGAMAHAVIDVVGYFAAPGATALDCITVSSAVASVPVNAWTPVDANCPAGRTATGGGYDVHEGTLGYPGVWLTTLPNGNGWRTWVDNQTNGNRSVQTFVQCCRVPGR
jgi:hypothetical protein